MQTITTTNHGDATTYTIYDYTIEYAVTLMSFPNSFMVYGVVYHEDYNTHAINDKEFKSARDAFEALKDSARAQLDEYDAYQMCELLDELVRKQGAC
jgi:hypothetical protein